MYNIWRIRLRWKSINVSHHSADSDEHGSEGGADGQEHGHGAVVEEEKPDAHDELRGHVVDILHEVRDDSEHQVQQQETQDEDNLNWRPENGNFRMFLEQSRKDTYIFLLHKL